MPPIAAAVDLPEPWQEAWPAEGLETVEACPVCGHTARTLLHESLVDNTFRTARGRWTMWHCATCRSGYLSPRPTAATIHEAYQAYYTHKAAAGADTRRVPLQGLRRQLANGYSNWRYGSRLEPASRWGPLAALLLPSRRTAVARELRHLPRLPAVGGALLDVGCGDGSFLAHAQRCGWQVLGLEPDPKAAQQARKGGVKVIGGGLERLAGQAEAFEAITMSHVIEHVHDANDVLRTCYRLLKPGGQLWIETPNVDALGHRVFGVNWRGLEAPRHLVVFSARALSSALRRAGFAAPTALPSPSPRRWMFERSLAMSMRRRPDEGLVLTPGLKRQVIWADLCERLRPDAREFLTVCARKAGPDGVT